MADKRIPNVTFEGVEILPGKFRNFSGGPDQFNPNGGKRYFNVVIPDEETAEKMAADGWNVRILAPREEGDIARHYMKVNVSFNSNNPPRIYRVSSSTGRKVELDEDTISNLDFEYIKEADIIVGPYTNWGDGTKISAYLNKMYVVVNEDDLDRKYAESEYPEE